MISARAAQVNSGKQVELPNGERLTTAKWEKILMGLGHICNTDSGGGLRRLGKDPELGARLVAAAHGGFVVFTDSQLELLKKAEIGDLAGNTFLDGTFARILRDYVDTTGGRATFKVPESRTVGSKST
jgi:hypothetical protein